MSIAPLLRSPRSETRKRFSRSFTALGVALLFVLASQSSTAATVTVNSTGDDDDNNPGDGFCFTGLFVDVGGGIFAPSCTLRAAIEETNALAGADVIEFAATLPKVAGVVEIRPSFRYPQITDQVTIDGYSADGYDLNDPNEHPVINISGSLLPGLLIANGFEVVDGSAGTRIQGLAIHSFNAAGIAVGGLLSPLFDITIEGCHIGISRNVFYLGNGTSGILLRNTRNATVGRTCSAKACSGQRNVIASSESSGIHLDTASFTSIAGNVIGTNTSGTATFVPFGGATPNGRWGIEALAGHSNQIGAPLPGGENLVSGNLLGGILIDENGASLYNNKVGTNLAGTAALPNIGSGVELQSGTNIVGSVGAGRNLISGNDGVGVESTGSNVIVGNVIGLSEDESTPLGNGGSGVQLQGSDALVRANIIGGNDVHGILAFGDAHSIILNRVGTNSGYEDVGNGLHGIIISNTVDVEVGAPGVGNIVGFNQFGIGVSSANGFNSVEGNYVGTSATGIDIGNSGAGIYVSNSPGVLIGGTNGLDNGAGNTINFNGGYGVRLNTMNGRGISTDIVGNYIGTNAADAPMGNDSGGIGISGHGYIIGAGLEVDAADVPDYANRIAHNGGPAVNLFSLALDTTIRGNEIYQSGGGGTPIDLAADGPTTNDVGDVDSGANHLQNSPEFIPSQTAWNEVSGDLEVRYRVNTNEGDAAYPLTVDFYMLNEVGGFADVYVGSDIYPDPSATLYRSVAITPPAGLDVTGLLLATATDADGNTSELTRQSVPVPEPSFAWSLILGATALASTRRKGNASITCD